jgi:hypothetical protein
MKSILSFVIILYCFQLLAQNSIYIGTKKYNATSEWQFTVVNGYYGNSFNGSNITSADITRLINNC